MRRASIPEQDRADATLYVDETHNYLALPRSFEDLLAEARGYRLSLVLAHQHMGQLPKDVRDALGANARTKVVFTCSPEDASALERHFAPDLSAYDLSHLATFQVACRPCVAGGQAQAFTFRTEPLHQGSPAALVRSGGEAPSSSRSRGMRSRTSLRAASSSAPEPCCPRSERTAHAGVPSSVPSSDPASDHSSVHHRSTPSPANRQVRGRDWASAGRSDSLHRACKHARYPLKDPASCSFYHGKRSAHL